MCDQQAYCFMGSLVGIEVSALCTRLDRWVCMCEHQLGHSCLRVGHTTMVWTLLT